MLINLFIKDVAIIDRLNIEFGEGLNVLTGETGAGKSIIIDSINAIMGDRVSKELIRTGKDKAQVEAVFQVNPQKFEEVFQEFGIEPEDDNTLIISREFSVNGKNICRINNRAVTVSALKKISEKLIDIHGQNDNQSLLRVDSHIGLLDSFAGIRMYELKKDYLAKLKDYKDLKLKLNEVYGNQTERERKIDLLKYQIEEIQSAKLKLGEDDELDKQKTLLFNSEKILNSLSLSYDFIFSGANSNCSALDSINSALSNIETIADIDEKYKEIYQKIQEVSYQIEDLGIEIRSERDKTEYNPDLLEEIEERLDLIFKLKRKYGNTIKDVLLYLEKIRVELDELMNSEEFAIKLTEQIKSLDEELYKKCKILNEKRSEAAKILESRIGRELQDLEMKNSQFKVNIEFNDSLSDQDRHYTSNGLDRVEFMISTNLGEPLKPLSKIASGGEMSRIMLAIKTILADVDQVTTLIFDEIDTGISGRAASQVAKKLSLISKNHQSICVTHLAQIACMADNNYFIEKVSKDNITLTSVKKLEEDEVNREIARILSGGDISDITLKHAQELVFTAMKFKESYIEAQQ